MRKPSGKADLAKGGGTRGARGLKPPLDL